MRRGLGSLRASVAPSPGAEASPDTKVVFSVLYSRTSRVTCERSELGRTCVFQGEAAALSDTEHGLGRPVPAGHPTGHLCLRVSECCSPGPCPRGHGVGGGASPGPCPCGLGVGGGHLSGPAPMVTGRVGGISRALPPRSRGWGRSGRGTRRVDCPCGPDSPGGAAGLAMWHTQRAAPAPSALRPALPPQLAARFRRSVRVS